MVIDESINVITRTGNDNEPQFEGPTFTNVNLSYCAGEVRVLQSVCMMASPSVIARTQNESHGCHLWFSWSDVNVTVKNCWVGLLWEMRHGCKTSLPVPKKSQWFGKHKKNRRQKNSKQFCRQKKWCEQFLYTFISITFQGWIQYRSFCSGRTMGALVKTIKYSSMCNLTLPLTLLYSLLYLLPYLTSYFTSYLTLPYILPYLTLPYIIPYITLP